MTSKNKTIARGLTEIRGGFAAAPIYSMLAWNDISRRYKRSTIGQLWITLSMGAMIFGMGIVFSQIFNIPTDVFIPYLAAGLVIWMFIQATLNESCGTFVENEGFIRQLALPRFTYLMRSLLRNLIIGAHNIVILPIVFVYYAYPVGLVAILAIPGLFLLVANLIWIGYILAILSARFRDIPQIVASILQVAFFVTPIMYKPTQLAPENLLVILNPFSSLLGIVRDPLIGQVPSLTAYLVCLGLLAVGWVVATLFGGRYSHRVVYWL